MLLLTGVPASGAIYSMRRRTALSCSPSARTDVLAPCLRQFSCFKIGHVHWERVNIAAHKFPVNGQTEAARKGKQRRTHTHTRAHGQWGCLGGSRVSVTDRAESGVSLP